MALHIKRKPPVITITAIAVVVVSLAGAAIWGFNIGSLAYSKAQARAYMNQHCELIGNAQGQRWYECDESGSKVTDTEKDSYVIN